MGTRAPEHVWVAEITAELRGLRGAIMSSVRWKPFCDALLGNAGSEERLRSVYSKASPPLLCPRRAAGDETEPVRAQVLHRSWRTKPCA